MTSIALGRGDVIVGVDTHKDQHGVVAIDGLGTRVGEVFVHATNDGYAELLAWAAPLGALHASVSRAPAVTASAWRGSCVGTGTR